MAAWEMPLVSLLDVSTIWTAIIQQDSLLNAHHTWEVHTLKHLKVASWNELGRWEGRKAEKWEIQPCSWELKVDSAQWWEEVSYSWDSLHLGGTNLVGIPAWVGSMSNGWVQKPGQGHSTLWLQLSSGLYSIQRNKAPEPDQILTSQRSPSFALGTRLRSTLWANLRTSTTESLFFFLSKGCALWLVLESGHRGNLAKVWLRSQLPGEQK